MQLLKMTTLLQHGNGHRHTSEMLRVGFRTTAIKLTSGSTTQRVTGTFWFPSAYESCVYTVLCSRKGSAALGKNVPTLIENPLLLGKK